ncbi:response regulator transcription factor [Streptomyces abikoensis]|uniref:Response regulator transcription factor n=1 Tax=Streptomyces abikoensis TaxID=97398 RepID=A0ABW7TBR6_9ACTN
MPTPKRPALGTPLTAREIEILDAFSFGRSTAEVASQMFVTVNTVKSHLLRINSRLGSRDRAHAIAIAYRRGLLDTTPGWHAA